MEYDLKKRKMEFVQRAKLEKKKSRARLDEISARELKCFWTWPWGHKYEYSQLSPGYTKKECIGCGKFELLG